MRGFRLKGFPAWVAWRSLLLLFVPSVDRKVRLIADWLIWPFVGRDVVNMQIKQPYGIQREHFEPGQIIMREGDIGQRQNGVLISNGQGPSPAYAQIDMQERGRLMIEPGEEIYEGQIVGIHSRDNDLVVNPLKAKKLTNIRAAGRDENIVLSNPVRMTLEQAMEFIDDDELVEVTPASIRLRKRALKEHERRRSARLEDST